jgi:Ulp1 family protease
MGFVHRFSSILAYPFTGTGGVEITKGDLNRLEPGEFLNDTLVEFSLKCVKWALLWQQLKLIGQP